MIKLQNVSAGYGKRLVLKDINLEIKAGEMIGLLGPNGGGKSTLLLTLSGVLPLTSGSIEVDGASLDDFHPKEIARRMASVPQKIETAFDLKALSLVLMGRYPYISFFGGYQALDHELAGRAMDETRTLHLKDRLTGELSGGELQRVIIARALAQDTGILLLDEASSGLDIARKIEIFDLLGKKHRGGATIVSAIHDLNLAALYCTRLVFIKNGRIVLDGPIESIFTELNLSDVYETEIKVSPHPVTSVPQAYFVPGAVSNLA